MFNSWVVTNFRAWFQLGRIDRHPIFSQVFFKNFWYLFYKIVVIFYKMVCLRFILDLTNFISRPNYTMFFVLYLPHTAG